MKKIIILSILFFLISPLVVSAKVSVKGYYKKNGTYVAPHYRSNPDSSPYNNYGFPGNYNPNTGKISSGSVDTYLNNYYKNKTFSLPIISTPSPIYISPILNNCISSVSYPGYYFNGLNWYYDSSCTIKYNPQNFNYPMPSLSITQTVKTRILKSQKERFDSSKNCLDVSAYEYNLCWDYKFNYSDNKFEFYNDNK